MAKKIKIRGNNAFSDVDPQEVGDVVKGIIKIIQDWLKKK